VPRVGRSRPPATRVQQCAIQALAALPPRAQVFLSGRRSVRIDGDTLAPEIQLALRLLKLAGGPPPETVSLAQAREQRRRLAAVFAGKPTVVGAVAEVDIDASVPLRARHYAPRESGGPHPLLVPTGVGLGSCSARGSS
jgi:acetyl esterase